MVGCNTVVDPACLSHVGLSLRGDKESDWVVGLRVCKTSWRDVEAREDGGVDSQGRQASVLRQQRLESIRLDHAKDTLSVHY